MSAIGVSGFRANVSGRRRQRVASGSLQALLFLASCSVITSAQAQLFQNMGLGEPKALALGNAVTADPPGIDSIHFNPAGLARLDGTRYKLKLLAGQVTLESATGDQSHAPAIRQAYESVNPGQSFPVDDQANRRGKTSDGMAMLPFRGLTETSLSASPFGGASVALAPGLTFATMLYTPVAMGYRRDRETDPAAYQGYEVGLTRITYLSPTLGWQLNDQWAVGLGVGISWHGFANKTKFRAPQQTMLFLNGATEQLDLSSFHAFSNIGDLSLEMEDPFSPSFNLGVLFEPNDWLALGLVYQSEAVANMKGRFRMQYTPEYLSSVKSLKPYSALISVLGGAPYRAEPEQNGRVQLSTRLPAHLAVGASVRLVPSFKLNFDVKWTQNSCWDVLTIRYDQNLDNLITASVINHLASPWGVGDNADPDTLRLPRYYQDVLSWAVGMEYQWSRRLKLRAGYEPRGSAVPSDRVDFMVPMGDAKLYSLGLAWQATRESVFSMALGLLSSQYSAGMEPVYNEAGELVDMKGESHNANDTTPGQVVYNPYAYLPISGQTSAVLVALSWERPY
jgi:long-subunit fatty acid transport protein